MTVETLATVVNNDVTMTLVARVETSNDTDNRVYDVTLSQANATLASVTLATLFDAIDTLADMLKREYANSVYRDDDDDSRFDAFR